MSEIKFRAWDKEKKRMYADVGIFPFPWNERTQNSSWSFSADGTTVNPSHENIALMQYTGLKDKNGKEIYEGDKLEVYMGKDKQKPPHVVGDICEFYFDLNTTDSYMRIQEKSLKIIGNIHENPELLEATG